MAQRFFTNPAVTGCFQFILRALDSTRQHEPSKHAIYHFPTPFLLPVLCCGVIFNSRDLILEGKSHSVPLFSVTFQEHVPVLSGFCHNRVAQVDSSNWDNPILKQENEDKQVQSEGATYRATQLHPCSLSSLPVRMPSQVNFACINAPVAAVLHASVCSCMESMVFLGKLNPSLSVS